MHWLKRNPLLGAVVLLFVSLLGLEVWLWSDSRQATVRALAALEQKKQDRDWLARQSPALSEENSQAIAGDLANARIVVADLRGALLGRDPKVLDAPAPSKSIDVYFDLASFVEKTRAAAKNAQVVIRPDERFGFSSYANEGPEPDLVSAVYRQRILAQYLVETLFAAHPRALLSLQREIPLTETQRVSRNQPPEPGAPAQARPPIAAGQAADYFELAPGLSIRVPGRVDSDAFRVEFTGQTPTLRAVLNSLAAFKLPCVVRSVEVQPIASDDTPAEASETVLAPGAPVPLVTQNLSKFAVVVEFVELVPVPAASHP
jgi:hypothetical protein